MNATSWLCSVHAMRGLRGWMTPSRKGALRCCGQQGWYGQHWTEWQEILTGVLAGAVPDNGVSVTIRQHVERRAAVEPQRDPLPGRLGHHHPTPMTAGWTRVRSRAGGNDDDKHAENEKDGDDE